ncbi:helix-turn-helix transcriptional regulator [Paremcibacter congregatus]|uniref:helix-turn-helix transcriptional regulator n=1 Tax=Paremcibacter congregatus TaxID=2043170 RepID=UPI0030EC363F|tara:strand:- start:3620 stop:3871 length:252 start_codon:yes stop_codon:yes gene_type:complete
MTPTTKTSLSIPTPVTSAWLDKAITTREASDLLSIPVTTLTTWRSRQKGPGFLKLAGKTVRYQRRTLFDWMASQQQPIPQGED